MTRIQLPSSTEIQRTAINAYQSRKYGPDSSGDMTTKAGGGGGDVGAVDTSKMVTDVNDEIGTDGSCEQLLLRALRYGTIMAHDGEEVDDEVTSNNAVEENSSSMSPLLANRNKETIAVLTEAWKTCPALEDPLVDALWLISTVLSSASASNENDQAPSMRALVAIVAALVRTPTDPHDPDRISRFAQKLQSNIFPISVLENSGVLPTPLSTATASSSPSSFASSAELLKKLRVYNTATFYKQTKYSLLHDASEGYARVLRYLVDGCKVSSCMKDEHSNHEKRHLHHQSDLMGLIGTFDLDPSRVLDLTLDVLQGTLYPLPSTDRLAVEAVETTLGTTNAIQAHSSLVPGLKPVVTSAVQWLLDVMREFSVDKLLPLIAFKLSGDEQQRVGDVCGTKEVERQLSTSTTWTTAFLVGQGILDLTSFVMQYCSPNLETEIEETYKIAWHLKKYEIESLSRLNKSADPSRIVQQREQLRTATKSLEANHGIQIALVLIRWGEWEQAKPLFSSSKTWSELCFLMPCEIGGALCDEFQKRVDMSSENLLRSVKVDDITPSASEAGSSNSIPMDADAFFVSDIDLAISKISDIAYCIAPAGCISSRQDLYRRMCRLLSELLKRNASDKGTSDQSKPNDESNEMIDRTVELSDKAMFFLKEFLVPSISLFPRNPELSGELWSVLTKLPYSARYGLYQSWEGVGLQRIGLRGSTPYTGKSLPLLEAECRALKTGRDALKRLTKDNVGAMGKELVNDTHATPLVVYTTILNQIESYDNLIDLMVMSQRDAGPLALDVLGYSLLRRLRVSSAGGGRDYLKDDGINVAQWLQSIETFIGVFFKLYPMVESRGILEYLIGRLREGHVMELGILRNLLKVSGGYSFADYTPAAQLNKRQLEGRAGSITLQRETMSFGIVEKVNPEAIRRLRRVLQRDGIGARLLVLIAQARDRLIFDSSHGAPKDVKLLGNLYDSCQVVMFILSEFLTAHEEAETDNDRATTVQISSPVEHHSKYLPSFLELTEILGFEPTISWLICRAPAKAARNSLQNVSIDGANPLDKFLFTESTRQSYMKQYPDALWSSIYPMLYEFFFTNELYDVLFPEEIYTGESSRIEKEIESLQLNQAEKAKNAAQIERLRMSFKQLSVDFQLQQRHVQKVISDFDESKSSFFRSEVVSEVTARMFLLHCVYPRSLLSPDDAMYASHFAMMLHNKWTPGFSTMHYLHELISVVSGTLFGVTEAEAANLAILLEQTWTAINRWRYDTDAFQREVAGKPGSYVESDEGDGTKTIKAIDNKIFTEWYSAWHAHLGIALIGCLKSHEYIHTRTALLVLTRLVDVFPTRPALGNKILEELKPLQDEDSPRPDIRAAATAYSNSLIQARDNGKWKEEDKEVAKARADKEKKEAKERKKQQQARMEEMAKDSEKITEKIGPRDGPRDRDRNSDRRRDRDRDFSMRRSRSPSPIGKGADRSHPPGSSFASMASILGAREGRDRGGPERSEDRDRRYPSRDRELDERDRGGRDDDRRRDRDNREYERERIDDRRWPRERDSSDSVGGRNAKRSRPSSPDEGRESDRGSSKRARMESDRYPSSRRNGGRGDSPARRPRSPEQPPPSRSRDAPSRRNR